MELLSSLEKLEKKINQSSVLKTLDNKQQR